MSFHAPLTAARSVSYTAACCYTRCALGLLLIATMLPAQADDTAIFSVTGNIKGSSCGFQTGDVNVPLGTHEASEFTGVGSTTGWFQFPLVSSGCTASAVHMTFTGTAAAGNANLFAVTGGAAGVGVDLQSYDGVQAVPNSGTLMNWAPRPAGGTYMFQARYMQTVSPITSGTANANVTVQMTYD